MVHGPVAHGLVVHGLVAHGLVDHGLVSAVGILGNCPLNSLRY